MHAFDFGRSKVGSGPYHFKKLWGADPNPVTYRCKLIGAASVAGRQSQQSEIRRFRRHVAAIAGAGREPARANAVGELSHERQTGNPVSRAPHSVSAG